MFRKFINLIIIVCFAVVSWIANLYFMEFDLDKITYSFIGIAVSYAVFKLVLEGGVATRIRESKTRYSFRKTTSILFFVVSFIIVLRIWIINPQALLVAYGLIAAGVAIALQDVFKNFAGGFAIFLGNIYRVGDRIEVNNNYGDVIDIGLFNSSLLEIKGWVDGDQATGRIVNVPNGYVLSYPVNNYTKDHHFIWDEIAIPVTYGSNWKKAAGEIQNIVRKETAEMTETAEREVLKLEEKYYLSKRNMQPMVFVTPTDNWIMLNIRYVVEVRDRRLKRNHLLKLILDMIQGSGDIEISSETLSITKFPRE